MYNTKLHKAYDHRTRIDTEGKAKVLAAGWGTYT